MIMADQIICDLTAGVEIVDRDHGHLHILRSQRDGLQAHALQRADHAADRIVLAGPVTAAADEHAAQLPFLQPLIKAFFQQGILHGVEDHGKAVIFERRLRHAAHDRQIIRITDIPDDQCQTVSLPLAEIAGRMVRDILQFLRAFEHLMAHRVRDGIIRVVQNA